MPRVPIRAAILTLLITAGATAGLARAAESLLDLTQVLPSDVPALLPPVTVEGRKGWDCTAEQHARARTLAGADLPVSP